MAAMSRGRRLAPLALFMLVLAACGGSSGGSTTTESKATLVTPGLTPPDGCYLTVFLIEDVTRKQVLQVQKQLLANRFITQIAYVPRALELKRFVKTHPIVAKGMLFNPFSDRFEVLLRTRSGIFSVIGIFATHGGPITNVKPSAACGQPS
jgi:hypothetical protein